MESTLFQLHSLGLAGFEPKPKNIVLSPDGKSVTIIDCWPRAFRESLTEDGFQRHMIHDFDTLENSVYYV
ncbi:hypothetical protein HYT23_06460 [Candidatus Pacearchaeota archaeon]|nr:hypothetical protein [Candidatus Pacearchaeota archaeon]